MPNLRAALRAVLLLSASTAVLAAAACGSSDPSAAPSVVTATATATPAGPSTVATATRSRAVGSPTATRPVAPAAGASPTARCRTADLSLVLGPVDAAAGQRQGRVVLQDQGGRRCSITGFGGLALLDAAGRPLPVTLTRVGPAPRAVTFGPRSDQISKAISWTVVAGDGGCVEPATVLVTPPDETEPLRAPWTYGRVCGGRIDGRAFGAG